MCVQESFKAAMRQGLPSSENKAAFWRRAALRILVSSLALVFVIGVFQAPSFAQSGITLAGSGGSSPLPVFRSWAVEYNKHKAGVKVEYVTLDTDRSIS